MNEHLMKNAQWISFSRNVGKAVVPFYRRFPVAEGVRQATLHITSMGLYKVLINSRPITDTLFNPGWTAYKKRLQVQTYDVTDLLLPGNSKNLIQVYLSQGWFSWMAPSAHYPGPYALLAVLEMTYDDGSMQLLQTDGSWEISFCEVVSSDIYNGETVDYRQQGQGNHISFPAIIRNIRKDILIPQEGVPVREQEELAAVRYFVTPKGERVLDFGQNLTGYVRIRAKGKPGDKIRITHAETLDKAGNFYTGNLRGARQQATYFLSGEDICQPSFTFMGFRYIRLDEYHAQEVHPEDFTAVAVYSEMKRTGWFRCGIDKVNRLYDNILWSQRSNSLDVPTDCPQRDERCGWTGDAQLFCRTAMYNYDCLAFYRKWLRDLTAEQLDSGSVTHQVPNVLEQEEGLWGYAGAAGWGDAAVIVPWQCYLMYGDPTILQEQYHSMSEWLRFIGDSCGEGNYIWDTGRQFGDWIALDAAEGSYKGATDEALVATAYYAYSASLMAKAAAVLHREQDACRYRELYQSIKDAYIRRFLPNGVLLSDTQTAHVLTLYMGLYEASGPLVERLAALIEERGGALTTGILGTAYILHVLSDFGRGDLAYSLLMRESYPSWLYAVNHGATTMWEHWDGVKPDGSFWDDNMNSFNHVIFGTVGDWLYGDVAGIRPCEEAPGFTRADIRPLPDKRLGWAEGVLLTPSGKLVSSWKFQGGALYYHIEIPDGMTATFTANGRSRELTAGQYDFREAAGTIDEV